MRVLAKQFPKSVVMSHLKEYICTIFWVPTNWSQFVIANLGVGKNEKKIPK